MNEHEVLGAALAKALLEGAKNDPASLTPVGPYNHGPGGLFSVPGQDTRVFSAMMLPTDGVMGIIPSANNEDDAPDGEEFGGTNVSLFTTITGVTGGAAEDFANQPVEDCADGARTGVMKVCTQISTFGRFRFSPRAPISLFRVGQLRDNADPTYLRLMNQPPMPQNSIVPSMPNDGGFSNSLNSDMARRFFEMRATMLRFFARRVFVGSPANNSGERRDISGLNLQVNTNKVDAITQNACTAMYSTVHDFMLGNVSTSTTAQNNLVRWLDAIMFKLEFVARREGLDPVEFAIVMRPEVFDEIVKVWPVAYYMEALTAINGFTNGRVVLTGVETTNMRDDMRNNYFLPIRGKRYRVVLDTGMSELNVRTQAGLSAGQYASSIFILPITVMGGIRSLYWKFYNHANNAAEAYVRAFNLNAFTFTTDGGLFRWYINFKNGCLDWTIDVSPSLRLRTPQLAARIDRIAYQPTLHLPSEFPDDDYFADGGRTNDPTQYKYYADWSTATPVAI